ncbi:MAG: thioredoxin family protein [Nocardioides sp.]|nr:thioredoxin family protein [Nocardioides sp.]
MSLGYETEQPTREDVDATEGPLALEFGANWCGICRAAKDDLDQALADHPDLRRIKVEDGPGLPLGRSFGIKLWPTLVLVRDGKEVARVVRPRSRADVDAVLAELS